MLAGGYNIPEDWVESRRMLEQAVNTGIDRSFGDLGVYLRNGVGGPRDLARAERLFLEGVSRGSAISYINLAEIMGARGEEEAPRAYAYCLRGMDLAEADSDQTEYEVRCARVRSGLNPAQIAEAEALAPSL